MACIDPNCNTGCSCNNCCPPTPPIPTPTPPSCIGTECTELYNSSCVNYTGVAIPCLNITTGMNLTAVIQNMANKLCINCTTSANLYSLPMKPQYLINGVQENGCVDMSGPASLGVSIQSIKINGVEKLTESYDFTIDSLNLELLSADNEVPIYNSDCDIVSVGHTYGNITTALNYLFTLYNVTGFSAYTSLVSIPLPNTTTDAHFYIQYPTSSYFEIIIQIDEGFFTSFKYTRDDLFYYDGDNWVSVKGWNYQDFIINISPVA
jgi:hypothetical protein